MTIYARTGLISDRCCPGSDGAEGPLPPFVSMRPKLENTVPRFVEQSHGQFAGWLGSSWDPMTIDADPSRLDYRVGDFVLREGMSVRRLEERQSLLKALESQLDSLDQFEVNSLRQHYGRAFELLASAVGSSAFDLTKEPERIRERYGRNPHGQSVLPGSTAGRVRCPVGDGFLAQ